MALLSALKKLPRSLKKLPRLIGEAMYDHEDILSPDMIDIRTPPFWTEESDYADEEGELRSANRARFADMPMGQIPTGTETMVGKRRTGPSKLGRMIGDALTAGIAGASTENIAGGGGMDIMRSIQAGQGALRQRDILQRQEQRQREQDEVSRRKTISDAEESASRARMYDTHADLYRKQAEAAERTKPKDEVIAVKDGLYNLTTNEWISPVTQPLEPVENQMLRKLVDPETPEEERKLVKEAFEARYGPRGRTGNISEAQIIYEAAGGDATARKALDTIRSLKTAGTGTDQREKKRRVSTAYNQYKNDLNNAEGEFSRAKAQLDKQGVKPGTVSAQGVESQMSGEEYEERLHELETSLQTKKNNAQGAIESTLAEYDVPFTPQRYGHPSTQRRPAGTKTEEKKSGEELPPEVAARIAEGTRVTFRNKRTLKMETWERVEGKLNKVR